MSPDQITRNCIGWRVAAWRRDRLGLDQLRPDAELIYSGTFNPGPWDQEQRPRDNKWTSGVFARDVDTGRARWLYQSSPHDLFDHDDVNEILPVAPYGFINACKGVDLKDGQIIPAEDKEPHEGRVVRDVCPASPGAKDRNPSAFSPITGLVYIPHINLCMDVDIHNANYIARTPFTGANVKMYPGPGGNRGVLTAWDPVNQRSV